MDEEELFSGVLPFLHTAEARSFRRAAERLGVSPAAVSKAVARLEERLGVSLLVRTSRAVALTPEGELFLPRCRQAVAQLREGRELVLLAGTEARGDLAVSVSPVVAPWVVRALPALVQSHPALEVRLQTTDRISRLAEENVDLAVRIGGLTDSTLVSRRLFRPRWVLVASPAYLAHAGAPEHPDDLARHRGVVFVAPDGRPRDWILVDPGSGEPRAVSPRAAVRVDQGPHLADAALAGVGLCSLLDFTVRDALAEGRLVRLLPEWESDGPPVHVVSTPERAPAPNVRAAVAWLRDAFAALR